MPAGRPRNPATTRAKPRSAVASTPPPPAALDLSAPASVRELGRADEWDIIIRDLSAAGVLCATDLMRLKDAIQQHANAATWQARLAYLLTDEEASESDRTKAQGNINSALASFNSIIAGVERSVMLRGKPAKTEEELER